MRLIQKLMFAVAACGLAAAGALASPTAPKSGVEYETLPQALQTEGGNKVEVIEFFSYSCPHCNLFDPLLAAWVKRNADKVAFKRVHVAFHGSDISLQRMYLALDSMGVIEKIHPQVFAALHLEDQRLNTDELVFDWVAKKGIDRNKFIGVYRSFGAQSWVNRANVTVRTYNIDQWPMIAVGGHYLASPYYASRGMGPGSSETEQQQAALQVMDVLVAKAKSEMK
jgi:thiol:disulfide interchange protein DsbA